ncbi:MAG: saccharopine dehydrogenase C-terminal domain-containing protein [Saprospiraceae bacterium]
MVKERNKFIIAGAGGIGRAVGLILADKLGFDSEIYIGDINKKIAQEVKDWILEGSSTVIHVEPFEIDPLELTNEMDYVFRAGDIILDCLPGTEAPRMASYALKYNMHYVNLTEYVQETEDIIKMVADAETGFILQSGLAPGYINILAHKLYKEFIAQFGVEKVDYIKMRVGALTKNVEAPHYYAFTWSPLGVATEYIKEANVLSNGELTKIPSLSQSNTRIIHGVAYEEDFTSGGAADLPEYFKDKANNLDYKTIRYPGHYFWVKEQIKNIGNVEDPVQALLKNMQSIVPHIEEDIIVLYASVSGKDKNGDIRVLENSQIIHPKEIGGHMLKAIQLTTAVPMLESARMLLKGHYKGAILQSQIEPEQFMSGPFVQMVYNQQTNEKLMKMDR